MKFYLWHLSVFKPPEQHLHRGDECEGCLGLWEGSEKMGTDERVGCREWGGHEKRHSRKREGGE